jgi:hypothetical protein
MLALIITQDMAGAGGAEVMQVQMEDMGEITEMRVPAARAVQVGPVLNLIVAPEEEGGEEERFSDPQIFQLYILVREEEEEEEVHQMVDQTIPEAPVGQAQELCILWPII